MHGSSPTRLEALRPDQWALLDTHRDRWAAMRIGHAAGDRAAAEAGVRLAYVAAELAPPARIAWCGGPRELADAWDSARSSQTAGANVRGAIIDRIRARATELVLSRLSVHVRNAVRDGIRAPIADAVGTAVVEAVTQRVRELQPRLRTRMGRTILRLARWQNPITSRPTFNCAVASSHQLGWLAAHDFVHKVCPLVQETYMLRGLGLFAANAGWILPHKHICWLVPRHTTLSFDARGRLHNATGPALEYPDGWSFYAWKGTEVPADVIEWPKTITLARINEEPNAIVRRCLIEIMTPRRFVAMGGADRVRQDETGILWRKSWYWGDSWAAVEVVDGTPGPDGAHRHYFLQVPSEMPSPRAAVAWSYGITEQQYACLELRT